MATRVGLALAAEFAAGGSPLLDAATVYLVPLANPDAAARALRGEAAWRGRPVDEDRDGRLDEDPAEDLDGDGLALQMRVPDPTGAWLADPEDPRAMREPDAAEGERGGFLLHSEGVDEDGDRAYNEDGPGGVRLEANWPHRWREHAADAGAFPLSEGPAKALADFILERPNIAVVIVLGREDGLADPPKGQDSSDKDSTEPREGDARLLKLLGERLHAGDDPKPRSADHGAGNFADWCYFQAGRLVLESALWSPPLEGKDLDDEVKLLRWNDAVYDGAGFVDWSPFEHPQLGAVEIGGWRPLARENPPMEQIPALVERWSGFLGSLAADLPRLEWRKLEVRDLGEGLREARVTLLNDRLLPTMGEMGAATRTLLPVMVRLELPEGGALLGGLERQSVTRLEGHGGHQEFRWLFQLPAGSDPAVVVAESQTAGRAQIALEVQG
ncbi:MAG: hypothetical protein H8E31_08565 [Planctomycetes bacterium]|nr:hypothetical protein [Planctomycetota bacterium]